MEQIVAHRLTNGCFSYFSDLPPSLRPRNPSPWQSAVALVSSISQSLTSGRLGCYILRRWCKPGSCKGIQTLVLAICLCLFPSPWLFFFPHFFLSFSLFSRLCAFSCGCTPPLHSSWKASHISRFHSFPSTFAYFLSGVHRVFPLSLVNLQFGSVRLYLDTAAGGRHCLVKHSRGRIPRLCLELSEKLIQADVSFLRENLKV